MSTNTFETKNGLSVSDFGRIIVSKDKDTGAFRSFGVRYEGAIIWVNDEDWHKAWIAGEVVPKTITIQQVQRRRYKTNEQGERIMENGRPVLEDVTPEIAALIGGNTWQWEMTSLKTKTQLQGEDDIEVWNKSREFVKREKLLGIAEKYNATAKKAAETATLTADQEQQLDAMLAMFEK